MSNAADFGPRPAADLVARALSRVPPDGRVVHLQGDLAAALLPVLRRGAKPHPGPVVLDMPEPSGETASGRTVVQGRALIWRAGTQDERHRPLQARRKELGLQVGDPWTCVLAAAEAP